MKFTCLKENFHQGLMIVAPLARKATNLPILSNILLQAEVGGVTLTSTNLEIAIRVQIRAKVEAQGSCTVPAKLLLDFIGSLPQGKIDCTLSNQTLEISSASFEGKIKGMPAEEFPLIPKVTKQNSYRWDAALGENAFQRVLFASSKNDPRPELNGVLFSFGADGKSATLAATDSFRLAESLLALQETSGSEQADVIMPAGTLEEVIRVYHEIDPKESPSISLTVSENQALFTLGPVEIISRLIEGKYPDYRQIIPAEFKTTVSVSRDELLKTIKSISLFSSTGLHDVHVHFNPEDGKITLTSTGGQFGEAKGELSGEIEGLETSTVFNYHYLLEGLNACSAKQIQIGLIDGASPAIVRIPEDQSFLYLVMPIKQ